MPENRGDGGFAFQNRLGWTTAWLDCRAKRPVWTDENEGNEDSGCWLKAEGLIQSSRLAELGSFFRVRLFRPMNMRAAEFPVWVRFF
jgi:hypothetical protein